MEALTEETTTCRLFEKFKPQITNMVRNYRYRLGITFFSEEDLMAEARLKVEKCFENYYDDETFIRYLATSIRHCFIDMKKEMMKYYTMHFTDLRSLPGAKDEDSSYNRALCEIAVDNHQPDEETLLQEKINTTKRILETDLHRAIFFYMLEGLDDKEISSKLSKNSVTISKIKKEHIWPAVKEVFKITDENYKKLTETNRYAFDLDKISQEDLLEEYDG